jgi:hypothetical protein
MRTSFKLCFNTGMGVKIGGRALEYLKGGNSLVRVYWDFEFVRLTAHHAVDIMI